MRLQHVRPAARPVLLDALHLGSPALTEELAALICLEEAGIESKSKSIDLFLQSFQLNKFQANIIVT